jgi:hypothetical protein
LQGRIEKSGPIEKSSATKRGTRRSIKESYHRQI